jgi:hypothetical protein
VSTIATIIFTPKIDPAPIMYKDGEEIRRGVYNCHNYIYLFLSKRSVFVESKKVACGLHEHSLISTAVT